MQLLCFLLLLKFLKTTQISGEQEWARFLSENFQNAMKRSLKSKLKYNGEKSVLSYFKAELKFLVMLSVSLSSLQRLNAGNGITHVYKKQVVYKIYAESLTISYACLPWYFKTLCLGCCWPRHPSLPEQKKLSLLPKNVTDTLIASPHWYLPNINHTQTEKFQILCSTMGAFWFINLNFFPRDVRAVALNAPQLSQ